MRGHLAVAAEWEDLAGDNFAIFRTFLQSNNTRPGSLPCNECSCNHRIISFQDGSLAGVCRCVPRECRVKALQPEDTVLWQLNWPKFTRAICKAFGLQSKTDGVTKEGRPATRQCCGPRRVATDRRSGSWLQHCMLGIFI